MLRLGVAKLCLGVHASHVLVPLFRSLGKHCFLSSLANRMIRMSKDEEMRKNKRNNVPEGSRVKVNLKNS